MAIRTLCPLRLGARNIATNLRYYGHIMGYYGEDDIELTPEQELARMEAKSKLVEYNLYKDSDGKITVDWTGETGRRFFRLPPYDKED